VSCSLILSCLVATAWSVGASHFISWFSFCLSFPFSSKRTRIFDSPRSLKLLRICRSTGSRSSNQLFGCRLIPQRYYSLTCTMSNFVILHPEDSPNFLHHGGR
jgi:hypothetical protein